MIQIDRTSEIPIHSQVASRLRYLIASGHFKSGDVLPSTRILANQLDISFHTVRKAYVALSEEKIVVARQGSGYHVLDYELPSKSVRMEQGATIVHEALQQLIGMGLDEQEIDYLIQEQTDILESEDAPYKIVLMGPFQEWAIQCAALLSAALRREILPALISDLVHHADADFLIVPYRYLRSVLPQAPNSDVIGIQSELVGDTLSQVARLLDRETLGLVTRYADAIGPLTSVLREQTRFGGQILAVSVEHGDAHLAPVLAQSELVLYTESAWGTIRHSLAKARKHAVLTFEVTNSSIERLRQQIPS